MPSKSSPCAAPIHSSAPPSLGVRAKPLCLHDSILRAPTAGAIAPAQNHDPATEHDSCNMRAAELLTSEREALGLTIEEAAEAAGVSMTTIWRRENGLVDLGPLKQLVALTKARMNRKAKP